MLYTLLSQGSKFLYQKRYTKFRISCDNFSNYFLLINQVFFSILIPIFQFFFQSFQFFSYTLMHDLYFHHILFTKDNILSKQTNMHRIIFLHNHHSNLHIFRHNFHTHIIFSFFNLMITNLFLKIYFLQIFYHLTIQFLVDND